MFASPAELLSRASGGKADSEMPTLVILDLSTPGLDVKEVVAALKEHNSPPGAVIAYDAHVRVAGLKAAREAGCDEVLTRGQFHQNAGQILQPYIQQQATRPNSGADA